MSSLAVITKLWQLVGFGKVSHLILISQSVMTSSSQNHLNSKNDITQIHPNKRCVHKIWKTSRLGCKFSAHTKFERCQWHSKPRFNLVFELIYLLFELRSDTSCFHARKTIRIHSIFCYVYFNKCYEIGMSKYFPFGEILCVHIYHKNMLFDGFDV